MGSLVDFLFGKKKKKEVQKPEVKTGLEDDMDFIKNMRGMGNGHKKKKGKK